MDAFLNATRERLRSPNNTQWVVVSGNEACDLDSASCALVYAYFKQQQLGTSFTVVPLCNIQRADMPLRTEIVYWLHECGLNWETLFYTDDIFDSETCPLIQPLTDVKLILVDHHSVTGRLKQTAWTVTEIIDHHRLEETSAKELLLSTCSLKRIEQVGSCASLVCAELLKSDQAKGLPSTLWKLLYGAILVDTVGISELGRDAGRLTDLDLRMACRIEQLAGNDWFTEPASRDTLFSGLERAKFDVNEKGLSVWDLLRRDMKIATGPQTNIACSTVSGMDFTVLLHSPEFVDAARRMCLTHSTKLLVCITVGSSPSKTTKLPPTFDRRTARKGLVIFSPSSQPELCDQLIDFLCHDANGLDLRSEPLQLDPVEGVVFTGIIDNIKVTRKAILPLLISFLKGEKPENPSDSKKEDETHPPIINVHNSDPLRYTKTSTNADGISWTLLNNLRAWLGTLKPKERFELVRNCLSQVVIGEEERRETELFQPMGILPAPVLQQVTEKLYLLSPFAQSTGVSSRKLTTVSDEGGWTGDTGKAGKRLNDFGVALNRGRRSTLPISHELRSYHHQVSTPKRVTFGQMSHNVDDTLSLPGGLPEKPNWIEPEYMSRLPAWFPDHLTSSSADAVEDVSFRLFRRLSTMPSDIKSPNTSSEGFPVIIGSEDQFESTTIDPAELELLRASVGELNRPVGGHDGAARSPSHFQQIRSSLAQRSLNWILSHPQVEQQDLKTHQSRTTATENSVKELPRSSSSTTHTSINGLTNDCISLCVPHP